MKDIKEFKPVVVGIDHGYGNMKTTHCVFTTGIEKTMQKPIVSNNYLKFNGSYYVIGESHLTYQGEKTETEDFYVLTLAALAEELKYRGYREANVIIAAGLPLAWVSTQKETFRTYLMQNRELKFEYKDEPYHVYISDIYVYPQGFAAIIQQPIDEDCMIADIGNGTMNCMKIVGGRPVETSLRTERYGVSICIEQISDELSRAFAQDYPSSFVEKYIRKGCTGKENKATPVIRQGAEKYAEEIVRKLKSYGYIPEIMKLYVSGGGACILKNFSDLCSVEGVTVIEDIKANAIGFEQLEKARQSRLKGEM